MIIGERRPSDTPGLKLNSVFEQHKNHLEKGPTTNKYELDVIIGAPYDHPIPTFKKSDIELKSESASPVTTVSMFTTEKKSSSVLSVEFKDSSCKM